ncbi:MAG: hypothetical protein WC712_07250 [Candidatus Brocadiia bacterium]
MGNRKHRYLIPLLCILTFLQLPASSGAEEKRPTVVAVGDLKFAYVPPTDQPLPHIANGYIISQEPIGTVHVPEFYLSERVVVESDFPDFFKTLRVDYPGFTAFTPYIGVEFIRYLNENYRKPFADAGIEGSFTIPRWEDMMAAFLRGGQPSQVAEALLNKLSWVANRWAEDVHWDGEDVGPVAIGGRVFRRELVRLDLVPDLFLAWPLKGGEALFKQIRNQDPTRTMNWVPLDILHTSDRLFVVFRTKEKAQ